jgi:hypothetical protein
MDISDAIQEISPERRETLVAAWQNMKPKTSMKTLLSKVRLPYMYYGSPSVDSKLTVS